MTTRPRAAHGDPPRDLAVLLRDDARLDAAVAAAQGDATRRHRLLGRPVVVWRDGRVVEEPPPGAGAGATGSSER